jgi:signal transduction histidine kinase
VRNVKLERSQTLGATASIAMLAALAIALTPGRPMALAIALAALGVVAVAARALPGALQLVLRRRSMILVFLLAALILAWVVAGVVRAGGNWVTPTVPSTATLLRNLATEPFGHDYIFGSSWPWRIGRLPLIWLVLALLCAAGGFVLNADAVRVQLGYVEPRRSNWRLLTTSPTRGGRIAIRAIPGVALVAVAAVIGVTLMSSYVSYSHPNEALLGMVLVGIVSTALVAGPVAIGLTLRIDIDKEGRAREEERRRFAAHLHDSVLQTLALIQRQAADPDAVAKLARRQEHALRAWMAGETDLTSATVAGAVRDMLAEIEDEQGIKVEMTAIGDTKLDDRGEEMVAAAREALRNAARHAPGAPVNLFLNINGHGIELFIRDSGPGFDFKAVPPERRGLRDAVIGRMSLAGGTALVESNPGDGTEIALRLPPGGRSR